MNVAAGPTDCQRYPASALATSSANAARQVEDAECRSAQVGGRGRGDERRKQSLRQRHVQIPTSRAPTSTPAALAASARTTSLTTSATRPGGQQHRGVSAVGARGRRETRTPHKRWTSPPSPRARRWCRGRRPGARSTRNASENRASVSTDAIAVTMRNRRSRRRASRHETRLAPVSGSRAGGRRLHGRRTTSSATHSAAGTIATQNAARKSPAK